MVDIALGGSDTKGLPCQVFKASVLWADAFYKLICPSVGPRGKVVERSGLRFEYFSFEVV